MEDGGLVLKAKDERRIEVLIRVGAGLPTAASAAALLGVGERQVRRLLAAYRASGPRGVVHGNRGRPPAHTLGDESVTRFGCWPVGSTLVQTLPTLAELLGSARRRCLAGRWLNWASSSSR